MAYDQRPDASEYVPYYQKYVALVPDGDIVGILAGQHEDTMAMLRPLSEQQALHAYAPDKWTVKEVVGHLADAERVFAYRALRFARGDDTPLAGFDENAYVPAGHFNDRPMASVLAELAAVRRATLALVAGLPHEALTRAGSANGQGITVRGLFWVIAGHEIHHRSLLASRYGIGGGEVVRAV